VAALVSVHNDGPDAIELRIGRQSILLQPGHDYRVATSAAVELCPLARIDPLDLAMHMGGRPSTEHNRYAED
jgi:hypothetical protein